MKNLYSFNPFQNPLVMMEQSHQDTKQKFSSERMNSFKSWRFFLGLLMFTFIPQNLFSQATLALYATDYNIDYPGETKGPGLSGESGNADCYGTNVYAFNSAGETLTYQYNSAANQVAFYARKNNNNVKTIVVEQSTNSTIWATVATLTQNDLPNNFTLFNYNLNTNSRYVRFRMSVRDGGKFDLDAIKIYHTNAPWGTPTGGTSNESYYINSLTTTGGVTNLNYSRTTYISYHNQSSTTFSQSAGNSINVSITSAINSTYKRAWVDWNNDGDFNDNNEQVLSWNRSTVSGAFTVPATQPIGNYRVRFAVDRNNQNLCAEGNASQGNYVDFTLEVLPGEMRVPASGNNSYTTCSGSLYDSGGSSGDYQSNSNGYTVIYPGITGNLVQLSGSVTVEGGYDYLTIYDGVGTGGTVLWGGSAHGSGFNCQTFTVPPITSITGPLTVRFYSDFSNNCSGFALDISCIGNCSGTPTGGTVAVTPESGIPGSTYTVSATGYSVGGGLTYQWQSNTNNSGWVNEGSATSNYNNYTATAIGNVDTVVEWRLRVTCTFSNQTSYSNAAKFTIGHCIPLTSFAANDTYINNIRFLGTLNDVSNTSTFSENPNGYQDFTENEKSIQEQGAGINIYMQTNQTAAYKAWVDWNKDGDFEDSGELVYTVNILQSSTTFGFVVPENTLPGDYKIRFRANWGSSNFGSCDTISWGEAEDYTFTVIERCDAQILGIVNGSTCGEGDVEVSATASPSTTKIRWYTQEHGGSLLGESDPGAGFIIEDVDSNMNVYAAAYNGNADCESSYRVEVRIEINPLPTINFESSVTEVCGETTIVEVTAEGDEETVYLIEEDFEDGMGGFSINNLNNNGYTSQTQWQIRESIFQPSGPSWRPAISSGITGNHFIMATSDIVNIGTVNTALVFPVVNTTSFTNLTLKFKMYFSRYNPDNQSSTSENVVVQYSYNGITSWNQVPNSLISFDVGQGTDFETIDIDMNNPLFLNRPTLYLRLKYLAGWNDGVAVDNIQLFGTRPLEPSFTWEDSNISVYTDPEATIEYEEGTPASVVYIKPSEEQLELYENLTVTATAELSSGCSATGTIYITNNTKVWNPTFATNWNSLNWKPLGMEPTSDQCVIIRKPVNLPAGTSGLAKSILVKENSALTIQSNASLQVTDEIVNEGNENNFVVQNDANLIQINPSAENVGKIKVIRNSTPMVRQDATQWSSPVSGQIVRSFSPSTLINRFYIYNEKTNPGITSDYKSLFSADPYYPMTNPIPTNWYEAGETQDTHFNPATYKFKKGWGYSIRVANNWTSIEPGAVFSAVFTGEPHNGDVIVPAYGEFTLVGNPYPSNIETAGPNGFFANNLDVDVLQFWTHAYPVGHQYYDYGYLTLTRMGTAGMINPETGENENYNHDGKIKVGQGFLVQDASRVGTQTEWPVYFNNAMRVGTGGEFFKPTNSNGQLEQRHRFWLSLSDAQGEKMSQILLGYMTGATNGKDRQIDGLKMGSSPLFSLILGDEFTVQGRALPFVKQDVIPLGFRPETAGIYTFNLDFMDGLFAEGQNIYIKDKLLYVVHNLSQTAYSFYSEEGEFLNRFEIVFLPEGPSDTADYWTKNKIDIKKQDNNIHISSSIDKIQRVEIFNMDGWSIYLNDAINNKEIKIPAILFGKQILVVTGQTETGQVFTKKLIVK